MRPLTLGPEGGRPGRPTQAVWHTMHAQEILKFKIAPHKQKSIVKKVCLAGRWAPLSTHKHNVKSGTDLTRIILRPLSALSLGDQRESNITTGLFGLALTLIVIKT